MRSEKATTRLIALPSVVTAELPSFGPHPQPVLGVSDESAYLLDELLVKVVLRFVKGLLSVRATGYHVTQ